MVLLAEAVVSAFGETVHSAVPVLDAMAKRASVQVIIKAKVGAVRGAADTN